jgi:hypothetical protein
MPQDDLHFPSLDSDSLTLLGEKKSKDTGERRRNTYTMIEGYAALRNHLDIKWVLLSDNELTD